MTGRSAMKRTCTHTLNQLTRLKIRGYWQKCTVPAGALTFRGVTRLSSPMHVTFKKLKKKYAKGKKQEEEYVAQIMCVPVADCVERRHPRRPTTVSCSQLRLARRLVAKSHSAYTNLQFG